MTTKIQDDKKIAALADIIRSEDFLYLATFADIMLRYIDIMLRKGLVNRLKLAALSHLIVRGGSLSHVKLAQLMLRSKHTITVVVDSLEKDGYITRTPSSNDRRISNIEITSLGLNYAWQIFSKGSKGYAVARKVMESLSDEERASLKKLTQTLRQSIIQKAPIEMSK
jgi:DNA-binding MarR family transcriptional regulator